MSTLADRFKGGWRAKALPLEHRAVKFKATRDANREKFFYRATTLGLCWGVGAAGTVALVCASMVALNYAPQPPVHVFHPVYADGRIGTAVGVDDAPKLLFKKAQDREALKRYTIARVGWLWQNDVANDALVKIMSSRTEQGRWKAERDRADYIGRKLGTAGQGVVVNWRANDMPSSNPKVRNWLILYDLEIWKDNNRESVQGYTITSTHEWHPELPMNSQEDRDNNAGGFQMEAFSRPEPITSDMRVPR